MILNQPCLLLAPHITPFVWSLNTDDEKIIDNIKETIVDGDRVKMMSVCTSYAFSPKFTVINATVSMIFSTIVFAWKTQLFSDSWNISFVTVSTIVIIFIFFIGIQGYNWVGGLYRDLPCVEHDDNRCSECMRAYSFYGAGLKTVEPCEEHIVAPYRYENDPQDCAKCSEITSRYCVRNYLSII